MPQKRRIAFFVSVVGLAVLAAHGIQGNSAGAAKLYRVVPGWGQLTAPLKWGEVPNVAIDPKGTVFVFTRSEPPVVELNAAGKVLKTWGQGMFVWPHGIRFDRDGNLWITDGRAADGNGQMVYKLSSDGSKVLMTLGTKGVSGEGPNQFNGVTDVAIAPNGDIFVSDGHVNSRIVKFTKDGKFIKTWGRKGTGPGEFNLPHSIAFDSRGRLLVADRSNKRIQLFDQDGTFLEEWKQFGEASGIFIMPDDTLYVTDWQDKKAIFIGSAKDGSIKDTIEGLTLAEGLTVDKQGDIYAAETLPGRIGDLVTGSTVRKLVKN
jgi:sugar lactone lactonase YvrE